jgi:signal transduction histidine kinase
MSPPLSTDPLSTGDLPLTEQRWADLIGQVSELTARLAHDLRSPLHLIVGYADLLGEESTGPITATQEQFIGLIQRGAKTIEQELDRSLERLSALHKTGVNP